ncbi:hypothetical protein SRB17_88790 [Streptomyces sp. RB17]|uniref:methyltransferase family protein n=1 Tax=Streptomyces sp. RB17 TaxID=2585197 RepID=UPI001296C469|nr:hypothetical protein [Streptomyces sp. RB17]
MLEMITGYWVTQILRATADLSLADHVAAGATTAEKIAEREGSDPATTYRLLRAASSIGLFVDAGNHRSPFHWQSWGMLPDAVRKGSTQMHAVPGWPRA